MDVVLSFSDVNWLSVLVATVSAFAIGGLWYSPAMLGNQWAAELKLSDEDIKKANMPVIFTLSFVLNFIAAIMLELFIGPDASFLMGLGFGLVVGVAWVSTAFGMNYLFARKSVKLFLIDSAYYILLFVVMGGILGIW